MHRVKRTGNYAALPDPPAGGTPGFFGPGDPGSSTPATIPGYDWFNAVQEEIIAPILAAGLTLDENDRGQLLAALNTGWGMPKSYGTSGYQRIPGGLVLQWGSVVTDGAGSASVTFPIAFSTGMLAVLVSSNVTAAEFHTYQNSGSLTGFFLQSWTASTGAAVGGKNARYLAIGY